MIDREKIVQLIGEKLEENMFLVDVIVNPMNVIHVEVDSFTGLTIDQCVAISRHIEGNLDRETEDFALEVSSPGADQPFKVTQQYTKNKGREVEVMTQDGTILKGILTSSDAGGIVVKASVKEKQEGSNRKILVEKDISLPYSDIKKTRVIISFK
jgi:ribosome maturation factor RimP